MYTLRLPIALFISYSQHIQSVTLHTLAAVQYIFPRAPTVYIRGVKMLLASLKIYVSVTLPNLQATSVPLK